jgi:hypothetical protein
MPKAKNSKLTQQHYSGRVAAANDVLGVAVYGRVIEDGEVPPRTGGIQHPSGTDEPLYHSQIFGTFADGVCSRFPVPKEAWMPKPDGPADGCGWDPKTYVVWKNLPLSWSTVQRPYKVQTLESILFPAGRLSISDKQLRADQVVQILADCIPGAGGNHNPIALSKILQFYGFDTQHQIDVLNTWIVGNANYGVQRYGFVLKGDALNFVAPATLLSDIAKAIQDKATPAM